jgi:DNA-binding transcriptional regulator YdaS (Cro superfamily)
MNAKTPLDKAADIAGGTVALALAVGVPHYNVSKWRKTGVPAKHVLRVEQATGVSRHDLRPDVFGPASSPERSAA